MTESSHLVSYRRAVMALVIVNVLWGSSFPFIKTLNLLTDQHFGVDEATASASLRGAASAWMIGLRFAVALVLFAMIRRDVIRRLRKPELLAGTVIGVFFCIGMVLQVSGLSTIPASRSGFLTSLAVVWTPILATVFERQRPRAVVLLGGAISLVGVSILTGLLGWSGGAPRFASDGFSHWKTGDTLTLLAVLFFSAQIVAVDWFGKRLDSLAFTPSMFGTTAALSLMFFVFLQPNIPELGEASSAGEGWVSLTTQLPFWGLILLLSIFPSLIAFSLMNRYQPSVTPTQASVLYTLEPLMASAWAMFVPALLSRWCGVDYQNEHLTPQLLCGGAVLLLANFVALWPTKTSRSTGEASA
ncbi:DMT family transporter [Rhodopirellula halodulae]|uniref:DMT family transporter n=1 Tax=Rhodopirellula halodulae TaxID=2894198 RepID=UPI001E49F26A|nr:DMT family transporter [Rhodopirellula sp. JC737]MCC9657734.1 DMT family transporter [Rhodopirellula sp. JC737]